MVDYTETITDDAEPLTDNKDKGNSIKDQHLNKIKTKTYIIYTIVTILASALVAVNSYYAVRFASDGFIRSFNEFTKDYSKS